jgi:uncharacterized protein YvpB
MAIHIYDVETGGKLTVSLANACEVVNFGMAIVTTDDDLTV